MSVQHINPVIERQARSLAKDNREADPSITRIFWFPDEREVRLVALTDLVPVYLDAELRPFHFRPSPEDDLPSPSAIVMIRPDERDKFSPPQGWGTWADAIEV